MVQIAKSHLPQLHVVVVIAALVSVSAWSILNGVVIFAILLLAHILSTPLLLGLSTILHRLRLPAFVAQSVLFLPFLCLCAYSVWSANPYRREQEHLQEIFADQIPASLKIISSKGTSGFDISSYQAWIRCDPAELTKLQTSPNHTPVDLSKSETRDHYRVFPHPSMPAEKPENWIIYRRSDWPPTGPNHHPEAWIITDSTYSWAFVNFQG